MIFLFSAWFCQTMDANATGEFDVVAPPPVAPHEAVPMPASLHGHVWPKRPLFLPPVPGAAPDGDGAGADPAGASRGRRGSGAVPAADAGGPTSAKAKQLEALLWAVAAVCWNEAQFSDQRAAIVTAAMVEEQRKAHEKNMSRAARAALQRERGGEGAATAPGCGAPRKVSCGCSGSIFA